MPAPSTIITFTDADGDEFPVRLYGSPATTPAGVEIQEKTARERLDELIVCPTMPVKITRVEAA